MDNPPRHNDAGPGAPEDSAAPDTLRPVELDDLLRRRPSPRPRILASLATAAGLLLIALLVLRALPPQLARQAPGVPSRPSQPMPATIALASTVAYGRVTLNGQELPDAPPLLIHPRQGDNVVMIEAPPFAPHVCAFHWDPAAGAFLPSANAPDNACTTTDADPGFVIRGVTVRWAIDVTFTPADLAQANLVPDALTQAKQAVSRELAALHLTTTVPAGDYIATGRDPTGAIATRRAASPLHATVTLAMPAPSDPPSPITCPLTLCSAIVQHAVPPGGERLWQVAVAPAYRWTFTDAAGHSLSSPTYRAGMLQITLAWTDSAWEPATAGLSLPSPVNPTPGALLCDGGVYEIAARLSSAISPGTAAFGPGVEGCLILGPDPHADAPATFVWRFGVLLAASSAAHALLPALPLAPPAEIAAVTAA